VTGFYATADGAREPGYGHKASPPTKNGSDTPVQEERNNNSERLRIRGFKKCLQS